MKVIFVDDVPNVAHVGQTKEVADGYARNFLFPRKLAVLANSQAAASVDAHLKKTVKLRAVEEAQMAELAKKIGGLQITLRAKVGENDKLYGSITSADIAEALSKAAGCVIDKKNIAMAEPIKQAGLSDVTIKFMHEITAVIKVLVVDENATDEMIAQAKAQKAEAKKEKAEAPAEPKKVKAVKEEKAEASAEPKKEKAEKKEKKPKTEKPPKEVKAEEKPAEAKVEKPAKAEKAVKEEKAEKPAKEKKAKAEKAVKEEAPAEAKTEEKKEKKPRAKAKKEDAAAE